MPQTDGADYDMQEESADVGSSTTGKESAETKDRMHVDENESGGTEEAQEGVDEVKERHLSAVNGAHVDDTLEDSAQAHEGDNGISMDQDDTDKNAAENSGAGDAQEDSDGGQNSQSLDDFGGVPPEQRLTRSSMQRGNNDVEVVETPKETSEVSAAATKAPAGKTGGGAGKEKKEGGQQKKEKDEKSKRNAVSLCVSVCVCVCV